MNKIEKTVDLEEEEVDARRQILYSYADSLIGKESYGDGKQATRAPGCEDSSTKGKKRVSFDPEAANSRRRKRAKGPAHEGDADDEATKEEGRGKGKEKGEALEHEALSPTEIAGQEAFRAYTDWLESL